MPSLERRFGPTRGPKFYQQPTEHASDCAMHNAPAEVPAACNCGAKPTLMFVNQLDSSTREGPREATREDTERHPQAWAAFVAEQTGAGAPMPAGVEVEIEASEGDGDIKVSGRKRAAA